MKFFLLVVVYIFGAIFYFYNQYVTNMKNYHEKLLQNAKTVLETSINAFEISNDNFHSTNADKIARILSQAAGASTAKRNLLREELKRNFIDFYHAKELDSIEGMNIIDKDGYSLLRFHTTEHYDDLLTQKRYSVAQMQKDFLYKKGLEFGIMKESFRFQYPLFYDGKYIGMYEYSVGFDVFMREMQKFFADYYMFWFKPELIEGVVREEIVTARYKKIYLKNSFVYAKKLFVQGSMARMQQEYISSLEGVADAIINNKETVVEYSYNSKNCSLIIIPIRDLSGKIVASMLADVKDSPKYDYLYHAIFETFIALLLSFLFLWIDYISRKNQQYMKNLLDLHHEMLIVTDGVALKNANKRFLDFFGYQKLKDFKKEHDCICDFFLPQEGYLQKEKDGSSWIEHVIKNRGENLRVKMLDMHSSVVKTFEIYFEQFHGTNNIYLSFRDITDELSQKELLEKKAFYDTLTQVYNRASFNEYLQKEIDKSQRYGHEFSLLMFDIDYFKTINDTYGHDTGDEVLKELARLVQTQIRDSDIFARWGGEEFMIISHTSVVEAEQMALKLRTTIANHSFGTFSVTCSFGVTQYRNNESLDELLKRCDVLLYSAKESGRNCVVAFD